MTKQQKDNAVGILFMSYLVFGVLATYLYPVIILHFSIRLAMISVFVFPLLWVIGLHYLIEWSKKYG